MAVNVYGEIEGMDSPTPSASFIGDGKEGDEFFTLVTRHLFYLSFDSAKELCVSDS